MLFNLVFKCYNVRILISGLNLGFDVFWGCFRSLEIWVSRVFWVFCDVDRGHVLGDRDQHADLRLTMNQGLG